MLPIGLKGLQCIPMNSVSPECSDSDTGLPDDAFCVHILQVVTVNIWIIFFCGLIISIVLLQGMHVGFQNLKLKEDLAHKYISFYRTRVWSLATLVTNWLTHSRLVDLIDVTMACEDANSKLIEMVTEVDVDAEKCVDDSLVQISKLRFGHKYKFLFGLWSQGFEVLRSRFWSWSSGEILKLKFGQYFAANSWLRL